jgi:hypothetical protein
MIRIRFDGEHSDGRQCPAPTDQRRRAMPEAVILQFDGVGPSEYNAVNDKLGIDMTSGKGDWPDGLLSHAAGVADSGSFVVTEVWESRRAQERFMESRLGSALAVVA